MSNNPENNKQISVKTRGGCFDYFKNLCKRKKTNQSQDLHITATEDPFMAQDRQLDKATYFALAKVPFDPFDGYHQRLLKRIYTILKGQDQLINREGEIDWESIGF